MKKAANFLFALSISLIFTVNCHADSFETRVPLSPLYVASDGVCNGNTPCYTSIQEAIDAATLGSTIKIVTGAYDENLIADSSENLTLEGGWNDDFTNRSLDTMVNSLTITDDSLIIVDKLILITVSIGYYINGLGQTFRLIPAGTFTMGSPSNEPGRYSDEGPQHQVTLTKAFYMQTTEVTQAQWGAVMGSNPSSFSGCPTCPIEEISWNDVQDYITQMNSRGEGTYSLPTEAQWEYSARAGSTTAFSNGGIIETGCGYDPNLDAIGWYCFNSDSETHPVAQKSPNAWGLYDMSGNVYEWCQDWFSSSYYTSSAVTDPTGPSSGSYRVKRGGSWSTHARGCRSAFRYYFPPDLRYHLIGFRLLRQP